MLHSHYNLSQDVATLTTVFPSLESLAIGGGGYWPTGPYSLHGRRVVQMLGGLKNFHTLELGHAKRSTFAMAITTETGPSTLVTLSALSKLRTLVVQADFFVGSTLGEKPQLYRETTVLPDSLRHLTLILNPSSWESLARQAHRQAFLRKVAPALLDEFPYLERVDLCNYMDDYRQHKVQTLAERSTADGGAVL